MPEGVIDIFEAGLAIKTHWIFRSFVPTLKRDYELIGIKPNCQLRSWMRKENWRIEPTMQLDNFDLIINLVALGMGVSFVPIRALALYNQRHTLVRVPLPTRFTRELVVVIRKHRKTPEQLNQFIANVLF